MEIKRRNLINKQKEHGVTALNSSIQKIKSKQIDFSEFIGIPKHLDVIAFTAKKGQHDLSWASDLDIGSTPSRIFYTAFSRRKPALEEKINNRKSKVQCDLPKNRKSLDKLLGNIKETERIIRQDASFIAKIRSMKPDIEIKTTKSLIIQKKALLKHSTLQAAPVRLPRSGIVLKDIMLY